GVDAGVEHGEDALAGHGVGGHPVPDAVGLVHQGLRLLVGEVGPGVERAVLARVVAAVGVELDPVGPVLHLLAHGLADGVGAVHDLHAFGHAQLPGVPAQRVHAGGSHGPGGHEHARAGNDAAVDGRL